MRASRIAVLLSLLASFSAVAAAPAYRPGNYESSGAIFDALYGFRTYNGTPLQELLRRHGLRITFVSVETVESLGVRDGDRPGDVSYDVYVEGTGSKGTPCGISEIKGTHQLPDVEEFTRRKGHFPLLDESGPSPTGQLMFWAATGRCSKAY